MVNCNWITYIQICDTGLHGIKMRKKTLINFSLDTCWTLSDGGKELSSLLLLQMCYLDKPYQSCMFWRVKMFVFSSQRTNSMTSTFLLICTRTGCMLAILPSPSYLQCPAAPQIILTQHWGEKKKSFGFVLNVCNIFPLINVTLSHLKQAYIYIWPS